MLVHPAQTAYPGGMRALPLVCLLFATLLSPVPRFEVNPNTGEAPGKDSIAPREASNTIFHNAQQPTALVMSVLARE